MKKLEKRINENDKTISITKEGFVKLPNYNFPNIKEGWEKLPHYKIIQEQLK